MKYLGIVDLPLASIRRDGGTQMRADLDDAWIEELAELPEWRDRPVVVREGKIDWLAGGFHRAEAARRRRDKILRCDLYAGTLREAVAWALKDNAAHGRRRSPDDLERCFRVVLADPEWSKWSNYKIADLVGVDEKTVRKYLAELRGASTDGPQMREVNRAGVTYDMDVSGLRKAFDALPPSEQERYLQDLEARANRAEPPPAPRTPPAGRVVLHLGGDMLTRIDAAAKRRRQEREEWIRLAIERAL